MCLLNFKKIPKAKTISCQGVISLQSQNDLAGFIDLRIGNTFDGEQVEFHGSE